MEIKLEREFLTYQLLLSLLTWQFPEIVFPPPFEAWLPPEPKNGLQQLSSAQSVFPFPSLFLPWNLSTPSSCSLFAPSNSSESHALHQWIPVAKKQHQKLTRKPKKKPKGPKKTQKKPKETTKKTKEQNNIKGPL